MTPTIYSLATETADRIVLGELTPPDATCGECENGFVPSVGWVEHSPYVEGDYCPRCRGTGTLPTAIEFDLWGDEKLVYGDDGELFFMSVDTYSAIHQTETTRDDLRRIAFDLVAAGGEWILRTAYPERVRETWPPVKIDGYENCPDCGGLTDENNECPGWRGEPSEHPRRPNLTIAAYVESQTDADRRIPAALKLADLCNVGIWARPESGIDLTRLDNGGAETYDALTATVNVAGKLTTKGGRHSRRSFRTSDTSPLSLVVINRDGSSPAACDDLVKQCRAAGVKTIEIGVTK